MVDYVLSYNRSRPSVVKFSEFSETCPCLGKVLQHVSYGCGSSIKAYQCYRN